MRSQVAATVDEQPLAHRVRAAQLPPPDERRRIRLAAGVTYAEIAAELEVSAVTAMRWEQGAATPRRHRAIAYRQLLEQLQKAVGEEVESA
jgi:DNA-binding transcriptional regulator YiaG